MKNLYTKNEFLNLREDEMINEGLFDFFGKIIKNIAAYARNIKGTKEIDNILNMYVVEIEKGFTNAGINLKLNQQAEEQGKNAEGQDKNTNITEPSQGKNTNISKPNTDTDVSSSYSYKSKYKLNEEQQGEVNAGAKVGTEQKGNQQQQADSVKSTAKMLKIKANNIEQIYNKYKNIMSKKMQVILDKLGGAVKNPKLSKYIEIKKDELDIKFLTAKMKEYQKDKQTLTLAKKLENDINIRNKNINNEVKSLPNTTVAEIKVKGKKFKLGVPYRYNDEGTIRTIEISKSSDKPDYVEAFYTHGDNAGNKQNFQISNIDVNFKPEQDGKYIYFSETNKEKITVQVRKVNNDGWAEVVNVENADKGAPFKVRFGALMNKKEESNK